MFTLVTGGAGFIGSHLVDVLMNRGIRVVVLDNLSSGSLENIRKHLGHSSFTFACIDLLNFGEVPKSMKGCEVVYHLAANPEVRVGTANPEIHYRQNVEATYNLLEALRKNDIKALIFTSTSTVYGEASKVPTPEEAPLKPISVYGASKLACEALITAYAHTYGFKAIIYRLANIVGSRSRHGVVYDFIRKLRENPRELEVLGDGNQKKSYLHVSDCIEAMLIGVERSKARVEVFNIGSEDQIDVKTVARTVIEEFGLKDVMTRFTGGVDGGRGWVGDVKNMLLDVRKIKSFGWKPRHGSLESIKRATRELMKSMTDMS